MEKFSVWLEARQSNPTSVINSLVADFVAFNREAKEKDAELVAAGASDEQRRDAYYDILKKYTDKPLTKVAVGVAAGGLTFGLIMAPLAAATFIGLGLVALSLLHVRAKFGDEDAAEQAKKLSDAMEETKETAEAIGAEDALEEADDVVADVEQEIEELTDNEALMSMLAQDLSRLSPEKRISLLADAARESAEAEDEEEREIDIETMKNVAAQLFKEPVLRGLRGNSETEARRIFDNLWDIRQAGVISNAELDMAARELTDHAEFLIAMYDRKRKGSQPARPEPKENATPKPKPVEEPEHFEEPEPFEDPAPFEPVPEYIEEPKPDKKAEAKQRALDWLNDPKRRRKDALS